MSDFEKRLRTQFLPAILHGDAEHKAWLREAVEAFLSGDEIQPPRGGGKEAHIARLEEDNIRLKKLCELNIDTLEVSRTRLREMGKPTCEIDRAIKDTLEALGHESVRKNQVRICRTGWTSYARGTL